MFSVVYTGNNSFNFRPVKAAVISASIMNNGTLHIDGTSHCVNVGKPDEVK